MSFFRRAHRVLAVLFAGGVVGQFFLSGAGVFGATGLDAHAIFGSLLTLVALLVRRAALAVSGAPPSPEEPGGQRRVAEAIS